MAFCNSEEFTVAKVGNSFCNFVLFHYATNIQAPTMDAPSVASIHHGGKLKRIYNNLKAGISQLLNCLSICVGTTGNLLIIFAMLSGFWVDMTRLNMQKRRSH